MWVTVSNLVLVVVTCGLFIPWAMVRMTQLHVESISLTPAIDLQEFADTPAEDVGAVGAETATSTGTPIIAVFCTISTETRLVRRTAPPDRGIPSRTNAPASLSSALWRPTSSRTAPIPAEAHQKAAPCTARVL